MLLFNIKESKTIQKYNYLNMLDNRRYSMNKKEDILNAWITIEQLAEGSINKNGKLLKTFHRIEKDWQQFFMNFLYYQKQHNNMSDKAFKKSGIVFYFGIFNFQEVVDILREKYNIEKTYEEISNSEKFTFALYFDHQLNLVADKVFLTMSGYIREHDHLPDDFLKVETLFREELDRKFEEGFHNVFSELIQKYHVSIDNFRYKFIRHLDNEDINLHSFFIEDLKMAKLIDTENINRYFNGFTGNRRNLDSHKESEHFNAYIFEEIALKPKNYPLGRFPSNPDYALYFMQQAAVNLALNDKNDIRSINGPPGTGKTTLLKDIFADLVVQQALAISNLSNKVIQGSLAYWQNAKLGVLPRSISDKNIIVASSNNGAVQNIVNELPVKEEIPKCFQDQLEKANYFKDISNSQLKGEGFGKDRYIISELLNDKNWGVFSLEGGNSINMNKLFLNIEAIEKDLEEDDQSNTGVYQEFKRLYNKLKVERDKVEKYSQKLYKIRKLKIKYINQVKEFENEKTEKHKVLTSNEKEAKAELERLREEELKFQKVLSNVSVELENLSRAEVQAERNYHVLTSQKPSFLWFQKIFNKSKIEHYFKKLSSVNKHLNDLTQQKTTLTNDYRQLEKHLAKNAVKKEYTQKQMMERKSTYERWVNAKNNDLGKMKKEIDAFEKNKSQNEIKEIDFSLSYEELQKSNPWFTKEFRILQSELFISALKVRKQFLNENVRNLKAARIIWNKQSNYIAKENGHEIISEAWQWINFAVPVISTTFASFGRMFKNLKENSIGNLFIDEAGQALPQASVGAIFRSKKVMVVGDPSQIRPVLNLDPNVLTLIGRHYNVDEKFVSANASTQTIVDDTSQYGFQKNEDEWIGIPLWVHRRSNYPMFTISNEISYDGLMVQGKNEDEVQGRSEWLHCVGKANDKYVKEQAELLKNQITKQLQANTDLADDIYVISPFRNVAYQITRVLDEICFTKRKDGKPTNVGTVHTFQGKEAKIVYFVLGTDSNSSGAAKWAVSEPNIMNVAATRAKEEFYIIGDKKLYASLGSDVANKTISIINDYNNK